MNPMMNHVRGTGRSNRRGWLLVGLVLALLSLSWLPSAAGAQETEEQQGQTGPAVLVVHRVDASVEPVEIAVLADDYDVQAGAVSLVEDGAQLQISGVRPASQAERPIELVYVIDSSRRLAQGDVFAKIKEAVAAEIRALPAAVVVSVVNAGDTATVRVTPTLDHEAAATSVETLDYSQNSAMFNAIDRAASLVSNDSGRFATVVAISGGPDLGSQIDALDAARSLSIGTTQLVAVRYAGGESGLSEIITSTGGTSFGANTPSEIGAAIAQASGAASDRLLITYAGATSPSIRGDAVLSIGSAQTAYSYPGGMLQDRFVALGPVAALDPGGPAFFRTTIGLYLAIALAFVGLSLAVYATGSLFLSGETSLEGLLDRYSGETGGKELDDEEQKIVQTALVRRAVEFSESFAENTGFLVKVEDLLERAKLPLRPGEAMSFYVAAIFLGSAFAFLFTRSIIATVLFTILLAVGIIGFVRFKASRRIRSFEKQLPDTLQLLAGTLRAGYSLPQGLEAVSHEINDPMGYELRRVMTEARLGREIEDALGATAERLSSPDFAWAVMAIGIQREVGGNLNELLMTVSDTMIARERLRGEVATLTAEGKMSAIILGGLPPGLGFVMWIMNPDYIAILFHETMGHIFLGLGFVSAAVGMAWMKKVITINV